MKFSGAFSLDVSTKDKYLPHLTVTCNKDIPNVRFCFSRMDECFNKSYKKVTDEHDSILNFIQVGSLSPGENCTEEAFRSRIEQKKFYR